MIYAACNIRLPAGLRTSRLPAALEQLSRESLFEPDQPLTERRLADVQVLSSCSEGFVRTQRLQELETAQVDVHNETLHIASDIRRS